MTNEIDKARADERRAIANAMDQWSTDPVVTNHEPERVCIAVRAIASLIAHGTYGRLVDAEGLSADVVSAAQIRAESIRADRTREGRDGSCGDACARSARSVLVSDE
jgi:hypothetical protein